MKLTRLYTHPWFWLALIVLLAGIPRLVNLEYLPLGSDGDVAWYGINALDWLDRGVWPYYIRELYGAEPLSIYGIGLMIPLVGISQTTARLATALWGMLGVALMYPAAYGLLVDAPERLRVRAGLLAALSMAISLHAAHVSRLGLPAPFIPTAFALLIGLTALARSGRGWRWWILAGAALALTQYIYIAARVIPLAVVAWFIHDALLNWSAFKRRWRGWVLMAVTALLLVSPNLVTYLTQPRAFFGRAEAATAYSGALIWTLDTSRYGGTLGLFLRKVEENFRAIGLTWQSGPYTTLLEQPILTPLFFLGFLITLALLLRFPRRATFAWLWLALPLVLLPDLLTSFTTQPHAMRQIDSLALIFLLSGIGLAYGWTWLETGLKRFSHRLMPIALLIAGLVIVIPTAWDYYRFFFVLPDRLYRLPEISWQSDQASLDMSSFITHQPQTAYLIPYTEWERSTISWLTAGVFRDRRSALNASGELRLDDVPDTITVMQPTDPIRVRWDGHPAQVDDRLWVLLMDGQTRLLPPLTAAQTEQVQAALNSAGDCKRLRQAADLTAFTLDCDAPSGERLMDRSGQVIATFTTIPTQPDWFAPRPAIALTADATFNDEVRLAGYEVPADNLTPGQVFFVTLYWQPQHPIREDYEIFVQLWNDAGEAVTAWQNVPFGAMYRMRIWRPDETLATHHWLRLLPGSPSGRYRLVVGLFRTLMNERVPVSGGSADVNNRVAIIGNLRVPLPDAPLPALASPPFALQFGDGLLLSGLDLRLDETPFNIEDELVARPGQTLKAEMTFDTLARPPQDYTLFLHLVPQGEAAPVAQLDRLIRPDFPTGVWRTGDTVPDLFSLTLPTDLTAGVYDLWLGVYYWQDGVRLPLLREGERLPADRLRLATLRVE